MRAILWRLYTYRPKEPVINTRRREAGTPRTVPQITRVRPPGMDWGGAPMMPVLNHRNHPRQSKRELRLFTRRNMVGNLPRFDIGMQG